MRAQVLPSKLGTGRGKVQRYGGGRGLLKGQQSRSRGHSGWCRESLVVAGWSGAPRTYKGGSVARHELIVNNNKKMQIWQRGT